MGACALLWCLGVWAGWQSGRAWLGLMVVGDYLLPDALFGGVFGGFYLRGGAAGSSHSRRHELTRLVGELWGVVFGASFVVSPTVWITWCGSNDDNRGGVSAMPISKAPLPTCRLLIARNYLEANRYGSF